MGVGAACLARFLFLFCMLFKRLSERGQRPLRWQMADKHAVENPQNMSVCSCSCSCCRASLGVTNHQQNFQKLWRVREEPVLSLGTLSVKGFGTITLFN